MDANQAPFRFVLGVRQGPTRRHQNGTMAPEWTVLDLTCGHSVTRSACQVKGRRPKQVRCHQCKGKGW